MIRLLARSIQLLWGIVVQIFVCDEVRLMNLFLRGQVRHLERSRREGSMAILHIL